MTPGQRWNTLLADDGSQHANTAVEAAEYLPSHEKLNICFPSLQTWEDPMGS